MRTSRAFSLIEMIAVLAIIAVLLATLLPHWIKRIDLAARRAEVSNLVTVSNALAERVIRGSPLFNETTWSQPVADWSMLPVSKVTANARRYSRLYFVEENAYPAAGYSQASQGSQGSPNPPQNLRALVVSTLGGPALDNNNCPDPDGGELDAAKFGELWNLADGTRPIYGKWANWNGQADDFVVQRVNFAPLFHHLVLLNRDTNAAAPPAFTINGSAPQYISRTPNNDGWGAYYLHATDVGLCAPNGLPMTRHLLQQDTSFVWEAGKWRAEILGAPDSSTMGDDFGRKAKEFLEATRYTGAFKGANQQGVVTAMYDFMFSYIFWANECPLFTTHGVSRVQVAEYRVLDEIGQNANAGLLFQFSNDLIR